MAAHKKDWHGTRSGYRYHKCRCPECAHWNAAAMRRYRARRAAAGNPVPNGWAPYNAAHPHLYGRASDG